MPQVIVNVSMPSELKKAIDQLIANGWYTSVSELVREGTRRVIKASPKLTINGFTEEFENQVLEAAKEPIDQDLVLETEEDIDKYFNNLFRKSKKKATDD